MLIKSISLLVFKKVILKLCCHEPSHNKKQYPFHLNWQPRNEAILLR